MTEPLKLIAESDPVAMSKRPARFKTDEAFEAWKAKQAAKRQAYEDGRHLWREMNPRAKDSSYDGPKTQVGEADKAIIETAEEIQRRQAQEAATAQAEAEGRAV